MTAALVAAATEKQESAFVERFAVLCGKMEPFTEAELREIVEMSSYVVMSFDASRLASPADPFLSKFMGLIRAIAQLGAAR